MNSPAPADRDSDNGPRHLIASVEAMIDFITRIHHGRPGSSKSDDVEVWEDEENLYLEIELPSPSAAGIDVCIQAGRVFFRIDK